LELYPSPNDGKGSQDPKVHVDTIQCQRCERNAPKLEKPPFKNPVGERVFEQICQDCWSEWLQHQTLLINHYGLDPRDPRAREFLYSQIDQVLLKGEEGEQVDTSRKGTIEH
jgi:Fe-S cluster biosynthesis and repair protein YggX